MKPDNFSISFKTQTYDTYFTPLEMSDDDSEDHETCREEATRGLHLVLVMRHLLIKAHLLSLSQIHGHDTTMEAEQQFAHKSTQTEDDVIERAQPDSVHQPEITYTWNEMRTVVNNERAKSRLRVEISALKERCALLETLCTNKGFFVPSKS